MRHQVLMLIWTLLLLTGFADTLGSVPNSRYQYADDSEYEGLLGLPWVDKSTKKVSVDFKCPKCMETQEVSERFKETSLYNGVIKLVGGNVVLGFQLQTIPNNGNDEFRMIQFAKDEEMNSKSFFRKFTSLTGRKDVLEIGMAKVSGLNGLWATTKMERRVGGQLVYRGVNRMYMIPLKNGKQVVMANMTVGVLGAEEIPYADFKAFLPVGEKIMKSVKIKEGPKWKFW